jgi:hypothetical protein
MRRCSKDKARPLILLVFSSLSSGSTPLLLHYLFGQRVFRRGILRRAQLRRKLITLISITGRKRLVRMLSTTLRKLSQNAPLGARRIIALGAAIVFGGLSSLAMGQETRVPESATTNQTTVQGVVTYPQPPAGFDPLTASDKELKRYGFPPRPDAHKAPEAYRHWRALVSVPRGANPTLQQTNIYNGPAQHAPAKHGSQ